MEELTTELTKEQIKRLYDVFDVRENEYIENAFIDKHNKLYINIYTESDFSEVCDGTHTYEPNLQWMVSEVAQKLIYIMFGVDHRGKEYED